MRPPGHLVRFLANPSAAKSVGVIALVLASLGTALGNLGLFSASEIQRTGNLRPIRKSAIQLVSETLSAKIAAETAAVSVTYDFWNRAGTMMLPSVSPLI